MSTTNKLEDIKLVNTTDFDTMNHKTATDIILVEQDPINSNPIYDVQIRFNGSNFEVQCSTMISYDILCQRYNEWLGNGGPARFNIGNMVNIDKRGSSGTFSSSSAGAVGEVIKLFLPQASYTNGIGTHVSGYAETNKSVYTILAYSENYNTDTQLRYMGQSSTVASLTVPPQAGYTAITISSVTIALTPICF